MAATLKSTKKRKKKTVAAKPWQPENTSLIPPCERCGQRRLVCFCIREVYRG